MQVVQQPAAVELFTEIDQLKARLAEAEKRERELNDKIAARPAPAVKQEEPAESRMSPARSVIPASSQRSGASLSLLVSLPPFPQNLPFAWGGRRSSYAPISAWESRVYCGRLLEMHQLRAPADLTF